jgi:protein phosphatase
MRVVVGARTDVGRLRSANEDAYLAESPLFVIADGMGGHIAGDVASSTAIETISAHKQDITPADPQTLAQLVHEANAAVWSKAQSDPALSGMGTTCTLVYVDDGRAHVAHVGDSRAYRLREGELERLTEDHTLVARMVKEGKLRPEDADHHPQRSIITRALGIDSEISVDLTAVELDEGDRLLLCSDGLTSMVPEQEIVDTLSTQPDAQAAADSLVEAANRAGGEDNVTVLVVDAGGSSEAGAGRDRQPQDPRRMDTGRRGDVEASRPRRGWSTRVVGVFTIIALVALAGYALARYALSNSWFVGVDQSDRVTIYSGIPEEIAGMDLRRKEEVTSTELTELPQFLREGVQEGIKVESLQEAQDTVRDLNDRAREFAGESTRVRPQKS